jgi:hypothetical protein
MFIDHCKQADFQWAPTSGDWTSFNLTQSVDANGWVNKDTSGGTGVNTEAMGNGIRIPATTDYSGAWVLTWQGNGTVTINDNGVGLTWTQDNTTPLGNTSGTYTRVGDSWTNQAGQNAVVVISGSGTNGPALIRLIQDSTGGTPYLTNLEFYRADDLTDKQAGLIFRRKFKEQYATLNPHSVRALDLMGANATNVVRFEHRNQPSYASWFENWGGNGQPKYSVITLGSSSCQWLLDPGGVSGMPASYQHGEQVTPRTILANALRAGIPIQAVSVATDAQVTIDLTQSSFAQYPLTMNLSALSWSGGVATGTVAASGGLTGHGLPVGATVQLAIAGCTPSGYNQSNATCTVTSATQFTYVIANPGAATVLGTAAGHGYANGDNVVLIMSSSTNNSTPTGMTQIDRKIAVVASSTPTTFLTGIASTGFSAFTTGYAVNNLTLNVGARGVKPVVLNDGNSPGLKYHGDTISQGGYCTFTYDSTLVANSGVTGAWIMTANGGVLNAGVPPEIVTALCNELMALNPTNPINLYITLPTIGLNSADNDYTSASNFAVNYIDVIINPASSQRAVGYSSLDSRCTLYVEHSNETWNQGPYISCLYQAWRGYLAFGGGGSDVSTYSSIRAVQTIQDVQAAFPRASWPKIEYILGMQSSNGTGAPNDVRLNGNANFNSVVAGGHTPLFYFDFANFACYANNDDSTPANSLTTNVAAFVAAAGNAAAEEAAYLAYSEGFKYVAKGGQFTIDGYLSVLATLATAVVAQGKRIKGYEGGFEPSSYTPTEDRLPVTNGLNTITASRGYSVGDYIDGLGWPARTKITANNGTTITLSNAFTGTTASLSYAFVSSPTSRFIAACRASASWATIHRTWFDGAVAVTGSVAPAEFITFNSGNTNRWYHTFWRDTYSGGVENAGLDFDYIGQGNRNRGL